jgi:hypothetical protein
MIIARIRSMMDLTRLLASPWTPVKKDSYRQILNTVAFMKYLDRRNTGGIVVIIDSDHWGFVFSCERKLSNSCKTCLTMTTAVDCHPKNVYFGKGMHSPRTVATAAATTAEGQYNNGSLCCSGAVLDDGNDFM